MWHQTQPGCEQCASARSALAEAPTHSMSGPDTSTKNRSTAALAEHRNPMSALWNDVSDTIRMNANRGRDASVTFYFGQSVSTPDGGNETVEQE